MPNKLQKEVNQLYYGEGLSGVGFLLLWFGTALFKPETRVFLLSPATFFSVLNISLILLTGSYFWGIMKHHVDRRKKLVLTDHQTQRFRLLQIFIIVMIIISTIAILVTLPHSHDMWLLIALTYIFMWLEYINYFHIRLSYLTSREFKQLVIKRKLTASHLRRAIKNK
ncbi:hypothetical protein ERX27_03680 [Macrococcus brunensis]|uniref:General stress protein n=1 Tax=Macrococcus brunensis TaxID=198483 RepID=A0A4R6BEP9_9STAP|nr:hypothetical protein [Macrococcus brunensis]TDL98249.1 hypothetical protein ERX27_03680 [Macrococcus brunensis]